LRAPDSTIDALVGRPSRSVAERGTRGGLRGVAADGPDLPTITAVLRCGQGATIVVLARQSAPMIVLGAPRPSRADSLLADVAAPV